VISGDIASTIVDLAIAENVDLITMTTHGYSGITRWMLGSVTERVLRHAPCPVLVVRCEGLPKNAVITLDGSELSESALSPGLALARLIGADVTLLFVDQTKKLGDLELNLLDAAGAGLGQQIALENDDSSSQYLRRIVEKYQSPSQEINSVLLGGPPAAAILDYVEREPVDLLIMATHGHTGLRRWVYGSVTEKCLHNTACAMLIVRPDEGSLN
jgi:nucleotide-binding universal stress UspA family protein